MQVDKETWDMAETLKTRMAIFGIEHDIYTCLASIILRKIPKDVTIGERDEAKRAAHMYAYSN